MEVRSWKFDSMGKRIAVATQRNRRQHHCRDRHHRRRQSPTIDLGTSILRKRAPTADSQNFMIGVITASDEAITINSSTTNAAKCIVNGSASPLSVTTTQ
jgi:hypothetical protein